MAVVTTPIPIEVQPTRELLDSLKDSLLQETAAWEDHNYKAAREHESFIEALEREIEKRCANWSPPT